MGIAGLGEAATEFLPAYAKNQRIRIVACADSRAVARDRFERDFGGRSHASIEELCAQPDVDAVVVATNHEYHVEPTIMAAEHGKHVIVEKPMALTLEDCDAMIDVCDRNGVVLIGGHNHSYDPPIRRMRELVAGGTLGPLRMINSWVYNDFMVRPYPAEHLRLSRGVVLNQGAHHVDVIRLLGGGRLRSVRAMTGRWDGVPDGEGAYAAYLEFEDGAAATMVYNGYGFFDTAEITSWLGEGGQPRVAGVNTASRQNYLRLAPEERKRTIDALKEHLRYGELGLGERATMPPGWEKGGRPPAGPLPTHQPIFGVTIVTCDRGDIRQTIDGLRVHGDTVTELSLDGMMGGRDAEIEELYQAVANERPPLHDGRWGKASIEVCLAMLRSASERREIMLEHQVASRD